MKLTSLTLGAFRSHKNVEFDLGPRVLFAGTNGTGKTTVRESIKWCLTGHCEGTDGKGAGAEVLIPWEGKSAEVSCVLDGIGTVSRKFSEKTGGSFSVEGFTGSSQIQQGALYAKLNTSAAFLDAVLSTETFLLLGHAEAKALVLSLLDVKIEVPDVVTPQSDGTVLVRSKVYTLDELDAAYKQAFEDRTVAKRQVVNWIVPVKPEGQKPTEEAIEGQLVKLRTQMGTLRQEIGTTIGKRTALNAELERVLLVSPVEEEDDLDAEIATLESDIAALEVTAPMEPAKGDPQRLAFLRSKAQALETHHPGKGCVLDAGVSCHTARESFLKAAGTLQVECEALDKAVKAKAPTAFQSPLMTLRGELREVQDRQRTLQAGLLAFQQAEAREKEIVTELATLPKTEAQELDMSVLEGRIQKGETFLKSARAYWTAFQAHEKAAKEMEFRKAEVARLETLVEVLGPKGARVAALATAMDRFEAAVNPYVQPFGWKISFSVEPWEVRANDRPVDTYSRSEQYRIGIALQIGIAHLSGLNMAIVDEVDMLDLENRALVTKMILKANLDQVIVLGTREPTQALPNGLTAFRLEKKDERTVIAERSAA